MACVPTGVKHLHHKAQDYDIGVYFEANGHGTVTFSEKAHSKIHENASNNPDPKSAGSKLEQLMNVINETVGDAISDMLLVESILHVKGWSVQDWSKAYTDLPNRLMKVLKGSCITPLQSRMNAKFLQHRFWQCHENGLIKTIQTIPPQPIGECQVSFPLLRIRINQDKP